MWKSWGFAPRSHELYLFRTVHDAAFFRHLLKTTESVRINKKIGSLSFRVFGSYSYNPCTIAGPKIMNTNEDRISTANATAIVLASRSAP